MLLRKLIYKTQVHNIGCRSENPSVLRLYFSFLVLISSLTFSYSSLTLAEVDCSSLAGNGSCEQETDPGGTSQNFQPNVMVGNPINLVTGNKYQVETDFDAYGSELSFRRYYNSNEASINIGLGNGWRMTYHTTMLKRTDSIIAISQSNGRVIQFTQSGFDQEGFPQFSSSTRQDGTISTDKNYRYWHIPDGRRLKFRGPFLVAIEYSTGEILSLNYRKQKLAKITSSKGPFIELSYFEGDVGLARYDDSSLPEPPGHVSSITTSTGNKIDYGYDHNNNLVQVQRSAEGSIEYQYKDLLNTALLTERHEYSSTDKTLSHTSWTYNQLGQATEYSDELSREIITFDYVYSTDNDHDGMTTITRSSGAHERYHWTVDQQDQQIALTDMSVKSCTDCPTTVTEYAYGADHNLLQITDGSYEKIYEYDSIGRLESIKTIDPLSGTEVSIHSKEYLEDTNLVVKESTVHPLSGFEDTRITNRDENGNVSSFSRDLKPGSSLSLSPGKTDLKFGRDDNGYFNQLTVNHEILLEVVERSASNRPGLVRVGAIEGGNTRSFEVSQDRDGRYMVSEKTETNGLSSYDYLPDDSRQVIEERIRRLSDQLLIKEMLEFAERVEGRDHSIAERHGQHTECSVYQPAGCEQVGQALSYAFLSLCVYEPPSCGGAGSDWMIVNPGEVGLTQADFQNGDGFLSVLVQNTVTDEYVLSFAGSFEVIDFVEDFFQAYGFTTPQYAQAILLADYLSSELAGDSLTFTGHSLGGGLAAAASLQSGLPSVVFNSAGLHPNVMENNGLLPHQSNNLITSFVVDGELVNFGQDLRPIYIPNLRPPYIPPYITIDAPSSIGTQVSIPAPTYHLSTGDSYTNLNPSLSEMIDRHTIGVVIDFLEHQFIELGCEHDFTH